MITSSDLTPAPEPWFSNIKHLVEANEELAGRIAWQRKRIAELEEQVRQQAAEVHWGG